MTIKSIKNYLETLSLELELDNGLFYKKEKTEENEYCVYINTDGLSKYFAKICAIEECVLIFTYTLKDVYISMLVKTSELHDRRIAEYIEDGYIEFIVDANDIEKKELLLALI